MKKDAGYKWKLGMFVVIGFLVFIVAIYFIGKQKNMFGSTFRLKAIFTGVSGLQVGNNVRFSGINVGTIDDIVITSDTSVKVEMVIQKKVQPFIKKDAWASIGSDGLMGDKVLIISPGDSSQVQVAENDLLQSETPVGMDEIMVTVKATAENAEVVTGQLADIMYKINNGNGTLSRLISDDKMSKKLDQTMNNLETSSKGLSENMEAAKHNFLLRGYFKKKEKAAEKKKKELEEQQAEDKKKKEDAKEPEKKKN